MCLFYIQEKGVRFPHGLLYNVHYPTSEGACLIHRYCGERYPDARLCRGMPISRAMCLKNTWLRVQISLSVLLPTHLSAMCKGVVSIHVNEAGCLVGSLRQTYHFSSPVRGREDRSTCNKTRHLYRVSMLSDIA